MNKQTQCPECDKIFYGDKCKCGFKKADQKVNPAESADYAQAHVHTGYVDKDLKRKVYKTQMVIKCSRSECQNPGSLGHSTTGGGAMYCREHFSRTV